MLACVAAALGQLPADFQMSDFAGPNPMPLIDGLSRLVKMSPEERHDALELLGEFTKSQLHGHCNAFGGKEACVAIEPGSAIAKLCPDFEARVDCIYYSEDMLDMRQTPVDKFKADLQARGLKDLEKYCPQCLDNLHKLWCAQALPKCGTFDALLDATMFPALELAASLPAGDSEAPPQLPDGWAADFQRNVSLVLPCREMCEAVVGTCSCGRQKTFGSVVSSLLPDHPLVQGSPLVKVVMAALEQQDICSVFAYRGERGFQGHCMELAGSCHKQQEWCSHEGEVEGEDDPDQLMLGPVMKSIFGWEVTPPDNGDKYVVHSGDGDDGGSGTSTTVVILSVLLALSMGTLLTLGGVWYWHNYIRRDTLDYVSMVELNDQLDPL